MELGEGQHPIDFFVDSLNFKKWQDVIQKAIIYTTKGVNKMDLEDIMQAVNEKILRTLDEDTFRGIKSFDKWLRIISRNVTIDYKRKNSKWENNLEYTDEGLQLGEYLDIDINDKIFFSKEYKNFEDSMQEISVLQKYVTLKYYFEGEKLIDIAKNYEINLNTIKTSKSRLLAKLKSLPLESYKVEIVIEYFIRNKTNIESDFEKEYGTKLTSSVG